MVSELILCLCCFLQYVKTDTAPDTFLNFTEIGTKYGYKCEEHDVVTDDNYMLKLFRLVGDPNKNPILMGHGIADTGDTFIMRGKSSLAGALATAGYDVWVLNARGTIYGRRHKTLNPDQDEEYWEFSFHDMGIKDLPANIDYVLKKTNKTQLVYIGHSQGNQMSYVMGSIRPEYNAKVTVYISLAPIAYLSHLPPPNSLISTYWPTISGLLQLVGQGEVFNKNSLLIRTLQATCNKKTGLDELCANFLFQTEGFDPLELEPDFLPIIFGHFPRSTSRKNIDHAVQVVLRNKFSEFDYGLGNQAKYGTLEPMEYPLHKISSPVVLIVGRNDRLSTIKDVKHLYAQLPYASYHEVQREKMNHVDFLWGKNIKDYLFPIIFEALKNHSQRVPIEDLSNDI